MIRGLKQKLWSMFHPDLYPEIGFERTLGKVILEIIALSGREITLRDESKEIFSACFCKDRRIAKLSTGDDERIFISHFSMRGVLLAYHLTRDLHEVARAVESWLMDELSLREMKQKLPNLDVSELAFETEAGRGVAAVGIIYWLTLTTKTQSARPVSLLNFALWFVLRPAGHYYGNWFRSWTWAVSYYSAGHKDSRTQ